MVGLDRTWRAVLAMALVALAGCATPSPRFMGMPGAEVQIRDMTFRVHYTPWQAEAIRTNAMWSVRRGEVMLKGAAAIERVSGCRVLPETLDGDAAIIRSDILCAGAAAMADALRPRPRLDCTVTGGFRDTEYAEFECDVIR